MPRFNVRTVNTAPAVEHARSAPLHRRGFGIRSGADPVLEDQLASSAALAHDLATGSVKRLARAGRISPQRASQWRLVGKGSPLCNVTELVYRATEMEEHPGAILAHLHATMTQAMLGLSDADLVRRFWNSMRREAEAEGAENLTSQTFAQHGDLLEMERVMLAEAAEQQELAAICRELRKRGIDPRSPAFN